MVPWSPEAILTPSQEEAVHTQVILPTTVVVPRPQEAVSGDLLHFKYHSLIYPARVPPNTEGRTSFSMPLTVADWKGARAAAAKKKKEEIARQRREARETREVQSVLEGLVSRVEAEEREVRHVLYGLIHTLEADERRRRAAERREAQVPERGRGRAE